MLNNSPKIILRPARLEDCPEIYRVHRHAVRYVCTQTYNERVMHNWLAIINHDGYSESMSYKNGAFWVAEYQNQIQGFFEVDFAISRLEALYVHPFFHRLGIGTAMLLRAEELFKQANLSVVNLYASENAVSFYQHNEYKIKGAAKQPLTLDNVVEPLAIDCKYMIKRLL